MLSLRGLPGIVLFGTLVLGGSAALARDAVRLPQSDRFQRLVLDILRAYPTDGTHGYYWPKGSSWAGTTQDLHYEGRRVADGDPQGRCYCCGLTFEVFFLAWRKWCAEEKQPFRIGDLSAEDLLRFRGLWYGVDGDRRLIQNALVTYKLGTAVEKPEDARPGDFVQFWRHNGSGHSVVFLAWKKDGSGRIEGLRYWSSQKSTNGIGEQEERIGEKEGIDPAQIYVGRVGLMAEKKRKR